MTRANKHSPTMALWLVCVVLLTLLLGSCSRGDDEPAVVTLPKNGTPPSQPPASLAPGQEPDSAGPTSPPKLAWSLQVGGPGDDALNAVTGNRDSVIAVGSTAGGIQNPTAPGTTLPTVGGSDALQVVTDGKGAVESLKQFGSDADDSATTVATVVQDPPEAEGSTGGTDNPGGQQDPPMEKLSVACGTTSGALGIQAFGLADGWCAPVSKTDGDPVATQFGGADSESITGSAAVVPGSAQRSAGPGVLYLSGATDGFYPGAQDPAGKGLGAGDALAFRSSATGDSQWIRQFGTSAADAALGVCAIDEDAVFVGWTEGDLEGPSYGGRDAWISLIDSDGLQRWVTQFGTDGTDEFVDVDHAGSASRGTLQFIAGGSTTGDADGYGMGRPAGGVDALIAAFGPDGSTLWSTQIGEALDDSVAGVVVDGATVYVAGTTTSSPKPTAVDGEDGADGGGPGGGSVPGQTTTTTAPPVVGVGDLDHAVGPGGGKDVFLAALDAATGETLWVVRLGSDGEEVATDITTTENGLLVISGTTTGKVADTAPGGGVDGFLFAFPLPSAGGGAASSV